MKAVDISKDINQIGDVAPRATRVMGTAGLAAGVLCVVLAMIQTDGWSRFYHAYLVSYCFFLTISLGALFFVILQHLTRAGWSVVVRRIAEILASNLGLLAILALPILFDVISSHHLYPWTRPELIQENHLLQMKRPYLNETFFIIRIVFYFALWIGLARFFFRNSIKQDTSGDIALTARMQRVSAPGMLLFALSVTFASFDLLMSLNPLWFSTIFGVYFFAGSLVAFFAVLPISTHLLQKGNRLKHAITTEHYHDMGKLIFAFIVFWAYIAFSQYMLQWYGNLPEETEWYLVRQTGPWPAASLFLLAGHFVIPFFVLLSRHPKRHRNLLFAGAIWVLAMHWFDLYWLVMPEISPARIPFSLLDAASFIGVGGLYGAAVCYRMRNIALIPQRDPRLGESLAFENA